MTTILTCWLCLSASLKTATHFIPIFLAVRITLKAISPLFATSIFSNFLPTIEVVENVAYGEMLLVMNEKGFMDVLFLLSRIPLQL